MQFPTSTQDITDDEDSLRKSIYYTKIAIVIGIAAIFKSLLFKPTILVAIWLTLLVAMMWRGYLAWTKLKNINR